jgi:hypothetical protein
VFKLTPPVGDATQWSQSLLYSFAGALSDGAYPMAGVSANPAGVLYGATARGGILGTTCGPDRCGAVVKLVPPTQGQTQWNRTVLYFFTGPADGSNPAASLLDQDGALYGTTSAGGPSNQGTVFRLMQ